MPKRPSPALAAAMKANAGKNHATPDQLKLLQKTAADARAVELEIASLEERLHDARAKLNDLYNNKLPDLMDKARIDNLGLPAEGNLPGVDYKIRSFYSASISTKWDDKKKAEAFDVLKTHNAESLIKTEVTARLPKGSLKKARALLKAAKALGINTAEMKESVHTSTLKAWLKELYEVNKQTLSAKELAKIGGTVGRTVRPHDREEE